jgi:hypothetical protein
MTTMMTMVDVNKGRLDIFSQKRVKEAKMNETASHLFICCCLSFCDGSFRWQQKVKLQNLPKAFSLLDSFFLTFLLLRI